MNITYSGDSFEQTMKRDANSKWWAAKGTFTFTDTEITMTTTHETPTSDYSTEKDAINAMSFLSSPREPYSMSYTLDTTVTPNIIDIVGGDGVGEHKLVKQNATGGDDPESGNDTPGGGDTPGDNDTTKFEGRWKFSAENFEINFTCSGNSFTQTMKKNGKWEAGKGTFTFTDTEMTITETHKSPENSYFKEAEAIAAMTEISKPPYSVGYTLDITKTPNTFALVAEGSDNPVFEKQNAASGNDTPGGSDTTKFEGKWKTSTEIYEMYGTFRGNSWVQIMNVGDNWWASKGTFTFTDTEITMTVTHQSLEEDSDANPITYSTEAEAIAAMTAVPSQETGGTMGYRLNTAVTPNTLTLIVGGGNPDQVAHKTVEN